MTAELSVNLANATAAMRAAHAEYEAAGGGGGVEEQRVLEREAR